MPHITSAIFNLYISLTILHLQTYKIQIQSVEFPFTTQANRVPTAASMSASQYNGLSIKYKKLLNIVN